MCIKLEYTAKLQNQQSKKLSPLLGEALGSIANISL